MQEKFKLNYHPEKLQQLLDDKLTIEEFLHETLLPNSASEKDIMLGMLTSYAQENPSGSPEVNEYAISEIKFNRASLTGNFRANYTIEYRFLCSDQRSAYKTYTKWDFGIDAENGEVMFVGEKRWRGMVMSFDINNKRKKCQFMAPAQIHLCAHSVLSKYPSRTNDIKIILSM